MRCLGDHPTVGDCNMASVIILREVQAVIYQNNNDSTKLWWWEKIKLLCLGVFCSQWVVAPCQISNEQFFDQQKLGVN